MGVDRAGRMLVECIPGGCGMVAAGKKHSTRQETNDPGEPRQMGFEAVMDELETVVKQLEGEELTLEKSIELFERGMRLATDGMKKLDGAEKKVEMLLREAEEETTVPFEPERDS